MRGLMKYVLLCGLIVNITGCANNVPGLQRAERVFPDKKETQNQLQSDSNNKRLVVWSYYDMTDSTKFFLNNHPEINVIVKQFDYNNIVKQYTEAFISDQQADQQPDIVLLDIAQIDNFNGLDVFENLDQPKYHPAMLTAEIPSNLIPTLSSWDGKRLIAIPCGLGGALTFYRADVLADNGFLSDPESVAEYMSTPDKWLGMAKKLRQNGIYIFQNDTDPIDIASLGTSLFDSELRFNRDGQHFVEALQVAREVKNADLFFGAKIWDKTAQEAMRSGKLVMFVMGAWGPDKLKDWVPLQSGKWRATMLPLKINGNNGGAVAAINKRSANKQMALEYIKGMMRVVKDGQSDSYLDGQNPEDLVRTELRNMNTYTPTPLDSKVINYWNDKIREAVDSEVPAQEQWKKVSEQVDIIIKEDRSNLLIRKNE
ncbi:ABC transporter substrate-binding protein [Paenibacillus sp. SI8]|uniref:ABC transporter substrate-binding protein n=1 Tax=unclassified Paenibacillus TaxID=185978 RepID=UPI003467AAC2